MKALPMPSLKLLWVARIYAVWTLISSWVRLIFYSSGPHTEIATSSSKMELSSAAQIVHSLPRIPETSTIITHVVYSGPTASFVVEIVFFACLAFGLFLLNRSLGRLMVGAAALGLLAMTFYGVLYLVYSATMASSVSSGFHHTFLIILAGSYCNAVLLFGYIWLALQPPESPKNHHDYSLPNHPLPQSC